ncbi:MAG: E3 binding domain-containing protein, partial [Desulfobacterales bacterium]
MVVEVKVPSVGESVTEALLAQWFKSDGDTVNKDEPLFVIETDKVTLEVVSEAAGVLAIKVQEGETVAIGAVVGTIDTAAAPKAAAPEEEEKQPPAAKPQEPEEPAPEASAPTAAEPPPPQPETTPAEPSQDLDGLAPSVRRLIAEKNLDPAQIAGSGPAGRITKGDVILFLEGLQPPAPDSGAEPLQKAAQPPPQPSAETTESDEERSTRKPMSPIRQRIA